MADQYPRIVSLVFTTTTSDSPPQTGHCFLSREKGKTSISFVKFIYKKNPTETFKENIIPYKSVFLHANLGTADCNKQNDWPRCGASLSSTDPKKERASQQTRSHTIK